MIEGNQRGHNGTLRPSEKADAERDFASARREWHGATYAVTPLTGVDRHVGDPTPHGVPPQYARPIDLTDLIIEGAPRALPVTQEIRRGPDKSRSAEFDDAIQEAVDLATFHASIGFFDRRFEGRRHRSGHLYEPRQEPYDIAGWQRDLPADRFAGYDWMTR